MDAHESLIGGLTEGYTETSNAASAAALAIDLCIYIGAVAVAVMAEPVWMRLAAVIVAGTATSTLFILGHDAAHKSLFTNRFANAFFARLVFLPCLHNYTLWVIQHNRIHHQSTNVHRLNSFSPLSVTEYRLLRPGAAGWKDCTEALRALAFTTSLSAGGRTNSFRETRRRAQNAETRGGIFPCYVCGLSCFVSASWDLP